VVVSVSADAGAATDAVAPVAVSVTTGRDASPIAGWLAALAVATLGSGLLLVRRRSSP
jgi:hypothetical protein